MWADYHPGAYSWFPVAEVNTESGGPRVTAAPRRVQGRGGDTRLAQDTPHSHHYAGLCYQLNGGDDEANPVPSPSLLPDL